MYFPVQHLAMTYPGNYRCAPVTSGFGYLLQREKRQARQSSSPRSQSTRHMNVNGACVTSEDAAFMRRALDLAARAKNHVYPNPAVGCVLVDSATGEIVGEGYHPKAGMPHAEVYALRGAGQRAKGATAYVTLEPCDHHGRTPPCSQALIDAGIAKVVVGVRDPNPLVDGGGIHRLREAGVEVVVGCEEQACFELNAEFMARISSGSAS